jgi:uncharacterized metal-binding protein
MPSGKVHSITTVILSAGLGLAAHQAGYPLQQAGALAGGALAGLLLTPDLDVNGGSVSMNYARRFGGCFIGLAWAMLWRPYSYLIPHRSPLSHMPLIGTAIRLGYMAALGWLVLLALDLARVITIPALPAWWPWSFAGLVLADLLHFILDKSFKN